MTNNTPDPDVAEWMKSLGFRQVPNRFDHGKHFVNDDMGGEIDEYQAAFFYHAQQRAVLGAKLELAQTMQKAWKNGSNVGRYTITLIKEFISSLEVQLQNNKEGKL